LRSLTAKPAFVFCALTILNARTIFVCWITIPLALEFSVCHSSHDVLSISIYVSLSILILHSHNQPPYYDVSFVHSAAVNRLEVSGGPNSAYVIVLACVTDRLYLRAVFYWSSVRVAGYRSGSLRSIPGATRFSEK
jgi:hypothetical protein